MFPVFLNFTNPNDALIFLPHKIQLLACVFDFYTNDMAGVVGFEPTDEGVKVPCLAAWRYPNISGF